MSENSRRSALKAALTAIAFVPAAATLGSQSSQSSQTTQADGSSGKKRPKRPALEQRPVAKSEGRRMAFKRVARPQNGNAAAQLSPEDAEALSSAVKAYRGTPNEKPSANSLPTLRLDTAFRYIRTDFQFSLIRCDLLAAELSQAINRCMQLRQEWESVYETSYLCSSDIERFYRFDAIFQMQEQNGYYDLDRLASQAELQAASSSTYPLTDAANSLKAIYDDLSANFNDQYGWIQLLGWLSHISGYGSSGGATATVGWNGVSDTVVNYCLKAAQAQGQSQLSAQLNQLFAGYQSLEAQSAVVTSRLPALQSRAMWDLKNVQFRQLQVQVMRDLYAAKQKLAIEPGGPLNYSERLAKIQTVFDATLSDGLSRVEAISAGLSILFGFSLPIPDAVRAAIDNPGQPQPSSGVLDAAADWIDQIGRWFSRFSQTEQTATMCFSIRDLISKDSWHEFLASGNVAFVVGEELLPQQTHVRCRAITMYSSGVEGCLSARVLPPKRSIYVHRDQSTHPVDQGNIPFQRFSRIASIDSPRSPERVGMNSAYNCSPLGEWNISLSERTSNGTKRGSLHDLFLEITLAEQ